jgi:cytochrome subunit of sulfide dehydrogenase
MTTRSLLAIVVLFLSGAGLTACQTTSNVPPAGTPAGGSKSAESRSVETAKPLTEEAVRVIAANCFNCHGPNGQSTGAIPGLANLSAEHIASQMKSFKNGSIASTVMGRHAKAYSDAEIDATAKYIAGLKK